MTRWAAITDCGRYRYALGRHWDEALPPVVFIGLNPSTADAEQDDPTIRRCIGFAKAWGFGGLVMLNLFAYRATQPADMMAAADPVGPQSDHYLTTLASRATVVAAWGANGTFRQRGEAVRAMLPRLHYLRLTKGGQPQHPLYLPGDLRPVLWGK